MARAAWFRCRQARAVPPLESCRAATAARAYGAVEKSTVFERAAQGAQEKSETHGREFGKGSSGKCITERFDLADWGPVTRRDAVDERVGSS